MLKFTRMAVAVLVAAVMVFNFALVASATNSGMTGCNQWEKDCMKADFGPLTSNTVSNGYRSSYLMDGMAVYIVNTGAGLSNIPWRFQTNLAPDCSGPWVNSTATDNVFYPANTDTWAYTFSGLLYCARIKTIGNTDAFGNSPDFTGYGTKAK